MKISGFRVRLFFLYYFVILISFCSSAESSKLDSLNNVFVNHLREDTVKANLLIFICKEALKQSDYNKQLAHYAPQLLTLSNKLIFKRGIAYAFYYMSMADLKKDSHLINDEYLRKSLKLMIELKDKKGASLCYERLGRVKGICHEYKEAIQFYSKAIQLKKELGDLNGMADCYSWMGGIYTHIGDYKKALECYIKVLKIAESTNYKSKICEAYISIGVVFYEQKKYKETIEYMNKALTVEALFTRCPTLIFYINC